MNLSPQRIYQLKKAGMPVDSVADAMRWYKTNINLRKTHSALPGPDALVLSPHRPIANAESYDIAAARAKREHHEANMAEMKERQLAGSLVDRPSMEKRIADAAAQIRMALERIPDRISDRIAIESDVHACHAILTAEIDQVLDDIASLAI